MHIKRLMILLQTDQKLNELSFVGFEVLTAVVMKSTTFWDITPCSLLSVDVSEEHIASIFTVEK
jgi:hypothetical protein